MNGVGKSVSALAALAVAVALSQPAAGAAQTGVTASVWTVHGHRAAAATSVNVLTLNDQRRIDNRIFAFNGPTGRLVLTAPEGLGAPDGSGANCTLDNAKPTEWSAREVS